VDKYLKESISMALNIFEPLKFSTQGINDLATQPSLVVSNGKITVDVVEPTKALSFTGGSFADVDGKGIKWTDGRKSKTLALKQSKLWTDMSVNLAEEQSYEINDTPVISFAELGPSVTKSNLKQVGTLRSLRVSGNTALGDFAYISSDLNRIGINVETPKAAIGIIENDVEIILGSTKSNTAVLGTVNYSNLEIVTDNTTRITVKNNGDVRIHGKIFAEEVITHRSNPLVFKETDTSSNYGKGIVWSNKNGINSQFTYQANPDRNWSTDSIELASEKSFLIEGATVLSKTALGQTVVDSNLTTVGLLKGLQVAGDAAVTRTISTSRLEIGDFAVDNNRLEYTDTFTIRTGSTGEFKIGQDIVIGNVDNTTRPVSIYGQLTVGVASPQANVALTVAGPVSFDNKKFETSNGIPTEGRYNKGDIVWNTDPKATDYIGWVCVTPGSPGAWLPFGVIASR
jgi:hypothetical protein